MRYLSDILAKAGLVVDGVVTLNNVANATIDTDKFLVIDSGVVKYRSGTQMLSDIGAAAVAAGLPVGGTAGQILAKIDGTNYNAQWIDNYAVQLKHIVKLGENMTIGTPVYVSSADGTNMIVSKASYSTEATSSKVLGLLAQGGVTNDQRFVITEGLLAGIDTSSALAGDPVWLGPNGTLLFGLANKPVAPNHMVYLGVVTRVQQNNGEIFVKVQNGFEIDELHDVLITSKANKDLLYYDSATTLWKNASLSTILGYTPNSGSGTTNYVTKWVSDTALGNSQIFDNGTNVGIGTALPAQKLDVSGIIRANAGTIYAQASGTESAGYQLNAITLGYDAAANIGWITAGSAAARTNLVFQAGGGASGGNVGIGTGTTAPAAKLHVQGAEIRIQDNNSNLNFRNGAGTRTGYIQSRVDAFDIWNDQATPMILGTSNTERLRITSNGDILYRGTYNPLSAANRGTIMLNGSASNIIGFSNNSALRGYIFHTDSDFQFYNNTTGGRVGLYTEGTARLWIQANGRVGINTTTDAGFQFDVNGTARINNDLRVNSTAGFNTLFTQAIGGGGLAMVSTTDPTTADQRLYSLGFGSVNYPAQARIEALATEIWSSTNRGSSLRFNTTANGATGSSVRMFIGNDGFVGINTSSPLARLHVAGNMRSDNDAFFATSSGRVGIGTATPSYKVDTIVGTNGFDGYNVYGAQGGVNEVIGYRSTQGNGIGLIMGTTGAQATSAIGGPNQSVIYSVGNQNLIFGTNSTSRMVLSPDGNLGLGMTPLAVSNYGVFNIKGRVLNQAGVIAFYDGQGDNFGAIQSDTNYGLLLANGQGKPIVIMTNSTVRLTVNNTGAVTVSNLAGTGTRLVTASENGTLGVSGLASAVVTGSGTLNYVPKWTPDGATLGNSQIIDNAASGVNIGAKTTIRDDGPFITGGNISGAGNNFAIGTTGGSALMMFTNSTQRVQIAADGKIGINATGALLPLTVYNPTLNTPVLEVRGGGGSSQTKINLTYGNSTSSTLNGSIFASTTDFALWGEAGRNMWFATSTSGATIERLRITSGGSLYFKGTSTTTNAEAYIENDNNALYISSAVGASVNKEIRMYFNGTGSGERFRIFNNGRVFIGPTPNDYGAYTLQVGGPTYLIGSANTALTTSAGLHYIAKGDNTYFSGFNFQGVAASDMFFGRAASSDDLIISTSNVPGATERVRFRQNGNVGIGISNPAYLLEVYKNGLADIVANSGADGNSAIVSAYNSGGTSGNFAQLRAYGNTTGGTLFGSSTNKMISLYSNGDSMFTIGTISGTSLAFGTTNIERMRISSTGHVGIGVTPSPWSGVSPSLQLGVSPFIASTGQYMFISSNVYYNGTNAIYTSNGSAASYGQSEGNHTFSTAFSGASGAVATFADRMRITSAGNVGIGTTTPAASARLDVTSTTQGFLPPRMTAAQRAAITSPAVGLVVYQTDGNEGLWIYTNANGWKSLAIVV